MPDQHPAEDRPSVAPYDDFPHQAGHDLMDGGALPVEAPTHEPSRAELAAEEAFASDAEPPQSELLGFYDPLRQRILATVERRAGKLSADAVRALLLVPDIFLLLVRLTVDKEVPGATRAMIIGALAYFVLPFDLLPEALVGPIGFMEDLVLAVAVLAQAFGGELEPYARKHWSGPEDLRIVLHDISTTADRLLGRKLTDRLRKLLGRRGIGLGGE
jgi:uncharacterized membrane protein YkvA (DUF1232 family)